MESRTPTRALPEFHASLYHHHSGVEPKEKKRQQYTDCVYVPVRDFAAFDTWATDRSVITVEEREREKKN
jgi:hypothetical protein